MWRNRIILLFFIILTGVFASFFGGPLPYALFYLSLLLPLTSYLYLLYIYNRFRVYQLIDKKTLTKHEMVPFRFILANEDLITYAHIRVTFLDDFSTLDHVTNSKSHTLLPGEREEYSTTLLCRYCGSYRVGIDKVILEDYFRIFRLSYHCPTPMEVHVLPRVLQPERISLFPSSSEGIRLTQSVSSQLPDAETRNYLPGDSPRLIHWKALARQGTLLTRKHLPEPKPEQHIFLDLALPKEEGDYLKRFDILAESVLAITNFYLNAKIPCIVWFDYHGLQQFPIHVQTDFEALYTFLCNPVRIFGESAATLLRDFRHSDIINSRCIVLTTRPEPELIPACAPLLSSGNSLAVLCFCKEDLSSFHPFINERFVLHPVDPDKDLVSSLERL